MERLMEVRGKKLKERLLGTLAQAELSEVLLERPRNE